jgi:hypothetical protein
MPAARTKDRKQSSLLSRKHRKRHDPSHVFFCVYALCPRSRSALEFRESLLDHKFGSALGVRTYPLTGAVHHLDNLFHKFINYLKWS